METYKTIKIPAKAMKSDTKTNKLDLTDYSEVTHNSIKYFYGCWIKTINTETDEVNSGGFLTEIKNDTMYLRTPKSQELTQIPIVNSQLFYTKNTTPQWNSVREFEIGLEKYNIYEKRIKSYEENQAKFDKKMLEFQKDRENFERIRDKFYKLFNDGKAKIIV